MELRDYLKMLWSGWLVVAAAAVIFAIAGYGKAALTKPVFQSFATFNITKKPQPANPQVYGYDNYYSLLAAAGLTEMVQGIITSPNTVLTVFEKANVAPPTTDSKKLAKTFRVQKISVNSPTLTVLYYDTERQNAKKVLDQLKTAVQDEIGNFKTTGSLSQDFGLTSTETKVVLKNQNKHQTAAVFALVGLILGSMAVIGKKYVKA